MKFYLETYGCSANIADSERIVEMLGEKNLTDDAKKADIVIVNSCGVKGPTEERIVSRLRKFRGKKVLVAGCLPRISFDRLYNMGTSMIGVQQVEDIAFFAGKVLGGERVVEVSFKDRCNFIPKSFSFSPVIEIIPISQGCLGACSYCATRFARGRLKSYPVDEIVRQAEKAIISGKKEIWVTSQDNSIYGKDIGSSLTELLERIVAIKGDFWVRVGMMNPKIPKGLCGLFKHPKIFKFAHIPVQSGSDRILESMRRNYSAKDFRETIGQLRKSVPGISISTDIICGYPLEEEGDWQKTIGLIKWLRPDVLNISKFYPRRNTEASVLKQLPTGIPKARSRELSLLFDRISLENNLKWVGWKGRVLIDEPGKGRNIFYKQAIAKGNPGEFRDIVVKKATKTSLIAQ